MDAKDKPLCPYRAEHSDEVYKIEGCAWARHGCPHPAACRKVDDCQHKVAVPE